MHNINGTITSFINLCLMTRMTILSSFLYPGNKEEVAYFFKGTGRNGNGALVELLKVSLGNNLTLTITPVYPLVLKL